MKKILLLLVSVFLIVGAFVGCSQKNDNAQDSEVTEVGEESIEIKIVYSLKADSQTVSMAKRLGGAIEESTIHKVIYSDDYSQDEDSQAAEIYLGDVTREETNGFISRILPCGYGYGMADNKLIIASVASNDLDAACEMFMSDGITQMNNTAKPFSDVAENTYMPETVTLVENGTSRVSVSADESNYAQAQQFASEVSKLTGAQLTVKSGTDGDIVFCSDVGYNECSVKISSGKITLIGYDELARNKASDTLLELIRDYSEKGDEKTLIIPKEYISRSSVNEEYPFMPYYKDGVEIYEGADSYTVYVSSSSLSELDAYGHTLEVYGYGYEYKREQSGNVFYTYTSDDYLVYAYYTAHDQSVRIVGSPIKTYDNLKSLNKATGDGVISLTQLDLGYKNASTGETQFEGMSYSIQLSDGSFILIDGGWKTSGSAEADNLYKWMKNRSPDGKVVISAWIITHLHHDHMGVFADFVTRYNSKVEIKAVINNYTTYEYWANTPNSDNTSAHKQYYDNYEKAVALIGNDKVAVPHNGQVVTVGDATIEFLYTHEDFYPQKFLEYNNSSLIFRVWVAGHTIMFSGDAQNEATDACVAMYGNYIASEFVQVSHHGAGRDNGTQAGSLAWYQHIDPKIVMYPMGNTSTYLGDKGTPANNWLQLESNCEEVYFGGNGAVTFEFPYTYGTSKVFSTYDK